MRTSSGRRIPARVMELTQNGVLVSDVNYNTLTYVYTRMHRHTQKHTCTHTLRHVLFSIVIHMAAIRGGNGVGLPSLAAQVVRVGGWGGWSYVGMTGGGFSVTHIVVLMVCSFYYEGPGLTSHSSAALR